MRITITSDEDEGYRESSVYVPDVNVIEEVVELFREAALGYGFQPKNLNDVLGPGR